MSTPRRPMLRYHGGKWLLAPWIISHFSEHHVYTEAYGGAASVLLRKPPAASEIYNDLDGEIVNLFRVLRDAAAAAELTRLLALTPFARAEFAQSYEPHPDPVEQARRTVVRSYMGRGTDATTSTRSGFRAGGHRPGKQHAARDWANYADAVPALTERLAGVVIEHRPALDVIQKHDFSNSLHYVDPPYPHGTRYAENVFRTDKGYRHELTDDDHRELAAVLRACAGAVVLSGYGCPLYDVELYPDWHRVERRAMADGASARTEVLWLNERAAGGLRERESRRPCAVQVDAFEVTT